MITIPLNQNLKNQFIELLNEISLFTNEEREVVLELLDIYLNQKGQKDYQFFVTTESEKLSAFICFGPTPMTNGMFDLYWIGTSDKFQRKGLARNLIDYFCNYLKNNNGRKIRIETSSKESYSGTLSFYRSLSFTQEAIIKDFYDLNDDLIIYTKTF